MRLLIILVVSVIAAIALATILVVDFRGDFKGEKATNTAPGEPVAASAAHGDFLIRCRGLDGETVSHIVSASNGKIDESGTSGVSIKGFRFAYSPGVPCTRHPITETQMKEYLERSK